MGPAVSWLCAMGMTPARLTRPSVGLIPTIEQQVEGDTMEPSVSVPMAPAHRLAATATPEPELDPEGVRSSAYGLRHWPPRPLQPLDEWLERKLAHSERFALPSSTAPPARSRSTRNASRGGDTPTSASEPAVLCIRSRVATLSFTRIGMPCNGPRGPLALRSASSAAACASASGFVSSTERSPGPFLSSASMRCRYTAVIARDVYFPDAIPACSSAMVVSSSSDGAAGRLTPGASPGIRGDANPSAPLTPVYSRNVRRSIVGRLMGPLSVPGE